ncbi:HipA domain-containing protein [Arcanobacterium wilhelmae]|uniref:HipA domain-containing protein n=1 Tax=Arcanobacterium wilhelmae TaxID=1803177 RepID=UPI0024152E85|nr:HipA domain-containing protein [Arcanobacterium wilhelmae]WFN90006.1 HipA domain-containing protein [Arcanobacterium wilhelmae]
MRELAVYFRGELAGTLVESSGKLSLRYLPNAPQVSLAMPVRSEPWPDPNVRPFILGFLPDSADQLSLLAREIGAARTDIFAILAHIGADCAGAIQFLEPGTPPSKTGTLTQLSDGDIEARLRELRTQNNPAWILEHEHWSLAGTQEKFALHRVPGTASWYAADGAIPSTHIVKPGVVRLHAQALIEAVSMRTLTNLGLPAAYTQYHYFGSEPALVSERGDRVWEGEKLLRLTQEDLCQALSVLPEQKYEADGGPGIAHIAKLFDKIGLAARERFAFLQSLIANYLLCATDAHAKNFSLTWDTGGVHLAPLYDVASAAPYVHPREKVRLAMKIGGENRADAIRERHWARCAGDLGFTEEQVLNEIELQRFELPTAFRLATESIARELFASGHGFTPEESKALEAMNAYIQRVSQGK